MTCFLHLPGIAFAALLTLAGGATAPAVAQTSSGQFGLSGTTDPPTMKRLGSGSFGTTTGTLGGGARLHSETAESARLRTLHDQAFATAEFGTRVERGFLIQQIGGPTVARSNAWKSFQPLSMLKVVPYFLAIYYMDRGIWNDVNTETVSWIGAIAEKRATYQEDPCQIFLGDEAGLTTQTRTAVLVAALPTMMYNSDNPIHEAMLRKIGSVEINRRLQAIGIRNTRQYYGCRYDLDDPWWAQNRTTLYDMAKLFRYGQTGQVFHQPDSRDFFLANLVVEDGIGFTGHISNIRDQSWFFDNDKYLPVVEQEAQRLGKTSVVQDFMTHVSFRSKGGGGGPDGDNYGENVFGIFSVPHKVNGQIEMKHYTMGLFTQQIKWPANCQQEDCADRFELSRQIQRRLVDKEMLVFPVHWALQTW